MVKWLYKILFVVISFSFFISATETDLGVCHNTFFDEFDTYAKAEQVSVDHASFVEQQPDHFVLLCCFFGDYKSIKGQELFTYRLPADYFNYYPPKLFLRNSVWRI